MCSSGWCGICSNVVIHIVCIGIHKQNNTIGVHDKYNGTIWGGCVTVIDQLSLSLSSLRRLRRNDGDIQSGFLGDVKLFRADGSGVGMEEACRCSLRNYGI